MPGTMPRAPWTATTTTESKPCHLPPGPAAHPQPRLHSAFACRADLTAPACPCLSGTADQDLCPRRSLFLDRSLPHVCDPSSHFAQPRRPAQPPPPPLLRPCPVFLPRIRGHPMLTYIYSCPPTLDRASTEPRGSRKLMSCFLMCLWPLKWGLTKGW